MLYTNYFSNFARKNYECYFSVDGSNFSKIDNIGYNEKGDLSYFYVDVYANKNYYFKLHDLISNKDYYATFTVTNIENNIDIFYPSDQLRLNLYADPAEETSGKVMITSQCFVRSTYMDYLMYYSTDRL